MPPEPLSHEQASDLLSAEIARLDQALSLQLREILHHPEFQKLEATWRGLHSLVSSIDPTSTLEVRVANATKEELRQDVLEMDNPSHSALGRALGEDLTIFHAAPIGLVMLDFAFDHSERDVEMLSGLGRVGAAFHALVVANASPSILGQGSAFTPLGDPQGLKSLLSSSPYNPWNDLRKEEWAPYLALTLPRVMGRMPYGAETCPVETFNFDEGINGQSHEDYLWVGAAWIYAEVIARSYATTGWPDRIRGLEGGGLVNTLPYHTIDSEEGERGVKTPVEVSITSSQECVLSESGFLPLVQGFNEPRAMFFSSQTIADPEGLHPGGDSVSRAFMSKVPYPLMVSRLAHYLQVTTRDRLGCFLSRTELEKFLQEGLARYVMDGDNHPAHGESRKPLRGARIDVEEVPGQPGSFYARLAISPHIPMLPGFPVTLIAEANLP